MRNPNEIMTYSGISIDPFAPRPEQICIEDIAHALSLMTRANGHISHFYSVGQHCLNCEKEAAARGLSGRVRLLCLLHDATECYMSDLTRPVKRRFPLYYEAEGELQRVIFTALCGFLPTPLEYRQVGEVDDCLLYCEFLALRGIAVFDTPPVAQGVCEFGVRAFEEVRESFLCKYSELSQG
jgi:hypothetical protein